MNIGFENQYLEDGEGMMYEDGAFEDHETADPFFESYGEEEYVLGEGLDPEGDQFFGGMLKKLARKAARVAGGAILGPMGGKVAGQIADRVLREMGEGGDLEDESEGLFEAMGGDPEAVYQMEQLAALAAESDPEQADQFIGAIGNIASSLLGNLLGESTDHEGYYEDGEQSDMFLPALIPLAAKVLPMAMPLVKKGITAAGKALFKSGKKHLVKALPNIAKDVVAGVARDVRSKRRVTPQLVTKRVGASIAKNVGSPRKVQAVISRPVPMVSGIRPGGLRHLAAGRYRTRAGTRVLVTPTGQVRIAR